MSLSVLSYSQSNKAIEAIHEDSNNIIPEISLDAICEQQRILTFISDTEEKLKMIEYQLIMQAKDLEHVSLTDKLNQNYLNGQFLFNSTPKEFQVKSPNFYIQKIRTVYFIILFMGMLPIQLADSEKIKKTKSTHNIIDVALLSKNPLVKLKRALILLKLQIYKSQKITRSSKKYFSEFVQFLNFDVQRISEENSLQNCNREDNFIELFEEAILSNLNKYPMMDQILIDSFLEQILQPISAGNPVSYFDDNFCLTQYLYDKLGLKCQFVMFRQFTIENQIVVVLDIDCFHINNNIDYLQAISKQIIEQSKNIDHDILDVSKVQEYSDKIFLDIQKSFIHGLQQSMIQDQPTIGNQGGSLTSLEFIPLLEQKNLQQQISKPQKACEDKSSSSPLKFSGILSNQGSSRSLIKVSANFSIRQISAHSNDSKPQVYRSTSQLLPMLNDNKAELNLPTLTSTKKISWQGQPIDYSFKANPSVNQIKLISSKKADSLQKLPKQEKYQQSKFNEAFFEEIEKQISTILIEIRQKFNLNRLEEDNAKNLRLEDAYKEKKFQRPFTSYPEKKNPIQVRSHQLKLKLGYTTTLPNLQHKQLKNDKNIQETHKNCLDIINQGQLQPQSIHYLKRKEIGCKSSNHLAPENNLRAEYPNRKNIPKKDLIPTVVFKTESPRREQSTRCIRENLAFSKPVHKFHKNQPKNLSLNSPLNKINPQFQSVSSIQNPKEIEKPKILFTNTVRRPLSLLKVEEKSFKQNQVKIEPAMKINSRVNFNYLDSKRIRNEPSRINYLQDAKFSKIAQF